jgi:uracil-DNA glycosylase family 4
MTDLPILNDPHCTRCHLHQEATNVCVPSKGSENPEILLVGIGPGYNEDKKGECFIGPAGQMLDSMLKEANVPVEKVRFANLVRCVPWQNKATAKVRDPTFEEIQICAPYLLAEIAKYKPKVIVPLGAVVANYFNPQAEGQRISALRGKPTNWKHPTTNDEYAILPTFHPAAVCRAEHMYRRHVVNDFLFVNQLIGAKDVFEGTHYELLDTEEKIRAAVDRMLRLNAIDEDFVVSVDTETGFADNIPEKYPRTRKQIQLNPFDPFHTLVSVQLSFAPKQGYIILLHHKDSTFTDTLQHSMIRFHLQRLFDVVKVAGQNFKFDYKEFLVKLGVEVKHFYFDAMLAHFLRYGKDDPRSLESIGARFIDMAGYKSEMGKALATLPEERRHMGYVDLDKLIRYGCGDSDAVMRYMKLIKPELEEMGFWGVYTDILQQATVSAAIVETNGMFLDRTRHEKLKEEFPKELAKLTETMRSSAWIKAFELEWETEKKQQALTEAIIKQHQTGKPKKPKTVKPIIFKPSSSRHLTRLFFQTMKLPTKGLKRTKSGKGYKTDKTTRDILLNFCKEQKNEEGAKLIAAIQLWKIKDKLNSAYVKNAHKLIYDDGTYPHSMGEFKPETIVPWCFHSNIKLEGTHTGRLSVELPNFQQVPRKSLIKWMFVSRYHDVGGFMMQGDYSQAELRVLAMLAGETSMLEAFGKGDDIHMYVASMVFGKHGKPLERSQITKAMRSIAKSASFGIVYGMGAPALALKFGTSVEEAQQIINTLYSVFPKLRPWMDAKIQECRDYGLVTSPMGRVRFIPDIWFVGDDSKHQELVRAGAERRAVNTPIQSAASDWNLCALNAIVPRTRGMKSLPVATIHDAIMFDVHPMEFFTVLHVMKEEMMPNLQKRFDWITLTPKADFEFGENWQAMTDFEEEAPGIFKIKGPPKDLKLNLEHIHEKGGLDLEWIDQIFVEKKEEDSWCRVKLQLPTFASAAQR